MSMSTNLTDTLERAQKVTGRDDLQEYMAMDRRQREAHFKRVYDEVKDDLLAKEILEIYSSIGIYIEASARRGWTTANLALARIERAAKRISTNRR